MPAVPFPTSSTPGRLSGEGEGRLVNAFVEKAGQTIYWRRVPGLTIDRDLGGQSGPRGMAEVSGTVYLAYSGAVVSVPVSGLPGYSGAIPGSDGVTFARNNRAPSPDLVAVRENGGAYVVAPSFGSYPDVDLPTSVNSVTFLDGFFLYTTPDGRIFASDLNSTAVNSLSFAVAESKPDGLKRGIVHGGTFYAMGTSTIEPWRNLGSSPFPLQRATSIMPVGLLTTMAVAGFEEGWDHNPIFVAHDGTVREIKGYETETVSTPDVERFIADSNPGLLGASVYTHRGHAIWSLSSNAGTWEYDVTTKAWHERVSAGLSRWRASRSVKSAGRWVFGDVLSASLLALSEYTYTEAGQALVWTIESGDLAEYPARVAIPSLFLDFAKGASATVAVSWSHDGGKTWSTPVNRTLMEAERYSARVNRLGLAGNRGLRVRLSVTDAVDLSFIGASVPKPEPRAA